jgi:hypothetical protein
MTKSALGYGRYSPNDNNYLYHWTPDMPQETWQSLKSSGVVWSSTHSEVFETKPERVLILTPLKNAAESLDMYFELLGNLTYPRHLISLGFVMYVSSDQVKIIIQQIGLHRRDQTAFARID